MEFDYFYSYNLRNKRKKLKLAVLYLALHVTIIGSLEDKTLGHYMSLFAE